MLKRIAVALPAASFAPFDALAVMKESQEVRGSQGKTEEDEGDKEALKSKEDEETLMGEVSVERWKAVAISVCRLNTWNGGEARATRCNLIVLREAIVFHIGISCLCMIDISCFRFLLQSCGRLL